MGFFDKIKGPVFMKEDSAAKEQLEQLKSLLPEAPPHIKELIEQDIRLLSAGIVGEENIAFELRNSHIPMFILHDLYLQHGDLSAQIDYLIITKKRKFIVECKNLYGNIEINSSGDFIRTMNYNGRYVKEGIYSPITQNKRHLELIKQIRYEENNPIFKGMFEKNFYDNYRAVVVLANPKTVLNARYAKKEVKNQVIRADQLIEYIRKVNSEPGSEWSEKETEKLASFFLNLHQQNPTDYTEKYRKLIEEHKKESKAVNPLTTDSNVAETKTNYIVDKEDEKLEGKEQQSLVCPKCGSVMVKRIAKKGNKAGSEFWGCSSFPKCKSIVNIL